VEQDGWHVDLQGAQVGDGNFQLNVFTGAVRARLRPDAYLEQVRRIAPPQLIGRDTELAELARFSLDPGTARYAWWRAGPWAGKSALMSTFVVRQPTPVSLHGPELRKTRQDNPDLQSEASAEGEPTDHGLTRTGHGTHCRC
jgi:hypothetical protein